MTYETDNCFADIWVDSCTAIFRAARRGTTPQEHKRWWWVRITEQFKLHPVVQKIIEQGVRPVDWHQLLLEWPHVSVDDETQIAYTRNEEAGRDFLENGSKRQTRTSIGKYLARHWPHVPDHTRRDWAGTFTPAMYEIWDTKEQIIAGVELGPQSCMKSSYGSIPFTSSDNELLMLWHKGSLTTGAVPWDKHPYSVYDPKLGWRMAVRLDKGQPDIVMGRALLHDEHKCFVRSYRRGEEPGSYSHTDEKLEAWLREAGYKKHSEWPYGVRFLKMDHPHAGLMMPYIDGDEKRVEERDGFMVLTGDGNECDNTDGSFDGRETLGECDDCGATVYEDEDDRIWAGRSGGRCICGSCADDYRYAEGRTRYGTESYYVHQNDVAESPNGDYYDAENLPEGMVQCEDGYVRDMEECVEVNGDWYESDSDEVVQCADDEYRMRADCWESATGKWYSDDDSSVSVDAGDYHPDELREMADNA